MVMNAQSDPQVAGARATWEGVRTIAWLWGEHDLSTAERLTDFLAVATADPGDLVIDLSAVSFMDASTISAIVRTRSRMSANARRLTVRSPSALMERVFGYCGLADLIERADDPQVKWPERPRSALESWVAISPRDPVPAVELRPAREEAHQASGE